MQRGHVNQGLGIVAKFLEMIMIIQNHVGVWNLNLEYLDIIENLNFMNSNFNEVRI